MSLACQNVGFCAFGPCCIAPLWFALPDRNQFCSTVNGSDSQHGSDASAWERTNHSQSPLHHKAAENCEPFAMSLASVQEAQSKIIRMGAELINLAAHHAGTVAPVLVPSLLKVQD